MLKEATRLYAVSWVRDIGPDLRPNDYKKNDEGDAKLIGTGKEKEPSMLEDLGENFFIEFDSICIILFGSNSFSLYLALKHWRI